MASPTPVARLTDVLGKVVGCLGMDDVGCVTDLIVAHDSGQILYAILQPTNRFGDEPGRYLAIPWRTLAGDSRFVAATRYRLPLSASHLKRAPAFASESWPDFSNSREMAEVHSFYGEPPR
jgi:hypothetical protein